MKLLRWHLETTMTESLFGTIEPYAGDPILSLHETFKADARPDKVNLGIGIYTNEEGKVPVLPSVRTAHDRIGFSERPYLPIEGHPHYRDAVQSLVFGASHGAIAENRIATIQTIGGTGAVGISADFLAKHCPGRIVFISDPSWENHHGLFQRAGFRTTTYPYWNPSSRSLNFEGMLKALEAAGSGAIVVLQPVCHNPTGVGLSGEQQTTLTEMLVSKRHIVIFDMAYQGFGAGLDEDASFVRRYAERASCLVANSFSKNFSLYGERCGGLSIVCRDRSEADLVLGQLRLAVRRSYSSPPMTGGLLVATVLGDEELRAQWIQEVARMRRRINAMRRLLAQHIRSLSNEEVDTDFLLTQRGMFSFTGLAEPQVRAMREHDGVYLVKSGRMCIAGITQANAPKVAASFVAASNAARKDPSVTPTQL
jgi:aromatic-amino-acid transaminase